MTGSNLSAEACLALIQLWIRLKRTSEGAVEAAKSNQAAVWPSVGEVWTGQSIYSAAVRGFSAGLIQTLRFPPDPWLLNPHKWCRVMIDDIIRLHQRCAEMGRDVLWRTSFSLCVIFPFCRKSGVVRRRATSPSIFSIREAAMPRFCDQPGSRAIMCAPVVRLDDVTTLVCVWRIHSWRCAPPTPSQCFPSTARQTAHDCQQPL